MLLILAVDDFRQALDQDSVLILGQQRIPVRAPYDLNDIPTGAAEDGLQLLYDLAVATDRAVQSLQVAVYDKGEVIQPLTRGQRDGPQGFRLVGFAVP